MSALPAAFIEMLQQYLPALAGGLLTYAVHSTLLLLAVWLLCLIIPPRRQQLKDVLWKTALAGGLLTAAFQLLSGMEPVGGRHILPFRSEIEPQKLLQRITAQPDIPREIADRLDSCRVETFATGGAIAVDPDSCHLRQHHSRRMLSGDLSWSGEMPPAISKRFIDIHRQPDAAGHGEMRLALTAEIQATGDSSRHSKLPSGVFKLPPDAAISNGAQSPETGAYDFGWMVWILLAWFAGVLLTAIRYFRARRQLYRLLADRRILQDDPILVIFRQLCRSAAGNISPRLTVSSRITSPMALSREEICLPQRALYELDPREQQTMLAHELAHILRRDHRWLHFCALLDILFFFQPLNRLARHRLQESAEYLCDDWAVAHTGQSLNLAKCLTRVAEWVQVTPPRRYVAAMGAGGSALRRRIARILETPPAQKPQRHRWPLLIAAALLLLTGSTAPIISADYLRENIFVFYMGDFTRVRENEAGVSGQRRIFVKSLAPQGSSENPSFIQMRINSQAKGTAGSGKNQATETQRSQRN